MERSRYFNTIEIIDDYTIKKSSKDKLKINAEYQWYNHNSVYRAPRVYSFWEGEESAYYTMEYIHGTSLARHFLNGTIRNEEICHIFDELYKYCTSDEGNISLSKNENTEYIKEQINSMYADKTYKRLARTNIDIDKEYKINGKFTPSIRNIIENCPVYLNDKSIRNIHGDLCFSNILLSKESRGELDVFTIDPRGLLPDGTITNIGDINYDVAKIGHSVIGRYDQIKDGRGFDIKKYSEREYEYEIETNKCQEIFMSEFYNHFSGFEYYNIMIHLFLSMIPLHADMPEHQEKMLVNALRLYQEKDN